MIEMKVLCIKSKCLEKCYALGIIESSLDKHYKITHTQSYISIGTYSNISYFLLHDLWSKNAQVEQKKKEYKRTFALTYSRNIYSNSVYLKPLLQYLIESRSLNWTNKVQTNSRNYGFIFICNVISYLP